jgi:hypothetical protein
MCGNYVRDDMRREETTATDATVAGVIGREN